MGLHRRLAQVQARGDLGVGQAGGHLGQHLGLALGQLVEALGRRSVGRPGHDALQHPPGHRGRQQGVARCHHPHRRHQLLGAAPIAQPLQHPEAVGDQGPAGGGARIGEDLGVAEGDADRLALIWGDMRARNVTDFPFSPPNFLDLKQQSTTLEDVAAVTPFGGAISIVTRDPGDQFKFTGDVTAGSYKLLQARGSADVPLGEGLSSSITFGIKSREGVVKRVPFDDPRAGNSTSYTAFPASGYDTASREGGENSWNLRGKLKWRGDATKVVVSGDYTREDSTGLANTLLTTTEFVPGNFAGTATFDGDASLRQRPMRRVLDPLALFGAVADPVAMMRNFAPNVEGHVLSNLLG